MSGKDGTADAGRKNTDWQAVERDYRTGKFTEQELADKYGATRSAVSKHKRTKHWTKDLQTEIRQATNARLVAEMVADEVAEGSKKVANVILAAAEVNKNIILSHRTKIADAFYLLGLAKEAVVKTGASVTDIREAAVYVQAAANMVGATKNLVQLERQAFDLDDAGDHEKSSVEDYIEALRGNSVPGES